ncbi:MAG: flagellar hook-associated protein FlgL [Gammaproteobacteria bacterium]|nr:flagellar hook-associated protein FlgL [Gammaproteobacteria bacterium]
MRISTNQIQQQGVNTMLDQQVRLSKIQQQLATGQRILTPADDPAGASQALDLTQAVAVNIQYQSNVDAARTRLNLEESALSDVTSLLQNVRTLAVQANNTTLSNSDRTSIAREIRQRLDELLSLSNTKDGNGEYLFAGYKGQTQPFTRTSAGSYTYNGDQGQRFLQVGPTRQVAADDSGTAVFQSIRNGNGTFTTLDNSANTGSGVINTGTVSGTYTPDTYTLILGHKTSVAGGAIGLTDTGTNDTLQYELRVNGALVYTAAEGSSRTQTQLVSDINAQSGTTGVRAYLDGGAIYLANTAPGTQAITVTETLTGASEDGDTVTGYFGSALTGVSSPSRTVTFSGAANGYVVTNLAGAVQTSGSYQSGANINFSGVQTSVAGTPNNGDRFTLSTSANQDIFTTLQNMAVALETPVNGAAGQAKFNNAMNRALTDIDQSMNSILVTTSGVGARINAIDSQKAANDAYTLQLQQTLSTVQDLDYASAASQLNQQLLALQAAQQSFAKVQRLTLFDYL